MTLASFHEVSYRQNAKLLLTQMGRFCYLNDPAKIYIYIYVCVAGAKVVKERSVGFEVERLRVYVCVSVYVCGRKKDREE